MGNFSGNFTSRLLLLLFILSNLSQGKGLTIRTEPDKEVDNTGRVNRDLTTGQPNSEKKEEEEEVYVQVTALSKKLKTEEDGTIILSPISGPYILSYVELSEGQTPWSNLNDADAVAYYMYSYDGTQLPMCGTGPFPSPMSPTCDRRIKFTGPDNNFTMSNMADSLYLRGRTGSNDDVVVRKKRNNKSYFIAQYQQGSPLGPIFLFFLVEDNDLAFRYLNGEVTLDNYVTRPPHTTISFQFSILTAPSVKFSDDCTT